MLRLTSKLSRFMWTFIYIQLFIFMGLIVILSVASPQHNLFFWQMAIGTILGTLLLLAAFYLWNRIPCKKLKQSCLLYATLLILYGILLYAVSCMNRNSVGSSVDYAKIWNAALELSEVRELSEEYYFKIYANNIKPMLYLSILFRVAKFFHISDPFFLILPFSVLQVLGAVWSVGILVGRSAKERAEYRIPVLILFVFTLPIWAYVQTFYTDSMSFVTGIIVLALIKLCFETSSRFKISLLLIFAGISVGIGMSIKITCLIPVIAGFIVFCFKHHPPEKWKLVGAFFLCTLAVYGATSLWAEHYTIWRTAKETSEPIIDWIALGMKGSGNYGSNLEYINYVTSLPSKQEKITYTLHYMWENRSDFWNVSHLVQKIRYNFASGSLGSTEFTFYAFREHNLLWELFSPWGKHYWRTSQLCFCYMFSIYTVYILGIIASLRSLAKRQDLPASKAIADLSMLGIIVFLMIWEANNRQLYNQVPIILLGAVMNARQFIAWISPYPKDLPVDTTAR